MCALVIIRIDRLCTVSACACVRGNVRSRPQNQWVLAFPLVRAFVCTFVYAESVVRYSWGCGCLLCFRVLVGSGVSDAFVCLRNLL